MFVGHFGLGFAAKRVAPTVSLGSLFRSVSTPERTTVPSVPPVPPLSV